MKKLIPILFIACFGFAEAQELNHKQGELLIQFQSDADPVNWASNWLEFENRPSGLNLVKQVAPIGNIWHATFDFTQIHEVRFLEAIRRDPSVQLAQFNHFVRNALYYTE